MLSLSGCSSADRGRKFMSVDSSLMLETGKSIAVISGRNDDNDIELTEMVIEKLTASGKFKVLPHSEVKKTVPRYPLNINLIDFYLAEDNEKRYTPYITKTSKEAIDAVQRLVKTDYVLVVWIDYIGAWKGSNPGGGESASKYMLVMTRLLSYPGGTLEGFSSRWNENNDIIFSDWEDFFGDVSAELVKEIMIKTK